MPRKKPRRPTTASPSSTLPFDPAELMSMRVTPAQLADMCNVTRQSVSKWIKNGWVSVGPDGLVDPKVAIRQYMDCVNPAKMRVRVLKDATASIPELRARIQSLEAELAATRQAVTYGCADDFAVRLCAFTNAILEQFDELQVAHAAGTASEWLDLLEGREVWQLSDADLLELEADSDDSRETSVVGETCTWE